MWKKVICRSTVGRIDEMEIFGKSEKVEKTICRSTGEVLLSVGRIDKLEFFLGKVKKWKKQSVEVRVLTLTRT